MPCVIAAAKGEEWAGRSAGSEQMAVLAVAAGLTGEGTHFCSRMGSSRGAIVAIACSKQARGELPQQIY